MNPGGRLKCGHPLKSVVDSPAELLPREERAALATCTLFFNKSWRAGLFQ